jgi:hypothetical protein
MIFRYALLITAACVLFYTTLKAETLDLRFKFQCDPASVALQTGPEIAYSCINGKCLHYNWMQTIANKETITWMYEADPHHLMFATKAYKEGGGVSVTFVTTYEDTAPIVLEAVCRLLPTTSS